MALINFVGATSDVINSRAYQSNAGGRKKIGGVTLSVVYLGVLCLSLESKK